MEAKMLEEGKPEPTLRTLQEQQARLNQYDGWIACLQWLNSREKITAQACQEALEAGKRECLSERQLAESELNRAVGQ